MLCCDINIKCLQETTVVVFNMAMMLTWGYRGQTKPAPYSMVPSLGFMYGKCQTLAMAGREGEFLRTEPHDLYLEFYLLVLPL